MQKPHMKPAVLLIATLFVLCVLIPGVAMGGAALLRKSDLQAQSVDQYEDGYGSLPYEYKVLSMSALVARGLVHPPDIPPVSGKSVRPYENPETSINWGDPVNISADSGGLHGSNEPGATMHLLNPLLAIAGGNSWYPIQGVRIENSTDGGVTWQRNAEPTPYVPNTFDGSPAWLASNINNGNTALFTSIGTSSGTNAYPKLNLSKSLNQGVDWSSVQGTNINEEYNNQPFCPPTPTGDCVRDREYLWTDQYAGLIAASGTPSPYDGRTYLTEVVSSFDVNPNFPSYYAVGLRWTTDRGNTWSTFVAANDTTEAQREKYLSQYPSLAILPNGDVVLVWRRGKCCGGDNGPGTPSPTPMIRPANDYIMWALSTDGGQSFVASNDIYGGIPSNQSIGWSTQSPGDPNPNPFPGFRWSDQPNVAADPVDGTLYAVWLQYRKAGDPTSAAVYLSKGQLSVPYISWSPPVIVYNTYSNKYQYEPWVQVSMDHTVHVTFGAALPSGTLNREVGQWYTQSTDRGQTFSDPFWLSGTYEQAATFMGDYNATNIGGYNGTTGTIMTTWTDTRAGPDRYGRFGTFSNPIPTPTACSVQFVDVPPTDPFYAYIECLACRGIMSGYACTPNNPPTNQCTGQPETCPGSYFRPCYDATRGEVAKIVANAASFNDPIPTNRQTFQDVPPSIDPSSFWTYVERLAERGVVSGYPCGQQATDPCVPPLNLPYFHVYASVTRGQVAKMDSLAAGYEETIPSGQQTFEDVPPSTDLSSFWVYIERLVDRGIVDGYACGSGYLNVCMGPTPVPETCNPPNNRPYFRTCNDVTRGQISKIVANTFFPGCSTPLGGSKPSHPAVPATPTVPTTLTASPSPATGTPLGTATLSIPTPVQTSVPPPIPSAVLTIGTSTP